MAGLVPATSSRWARPPKTAPWRKPDRGGRDKPGHDRWRELFLAAAIATTLTTPALAQSKKPDPAFGEYLSSECVTCHRLAGDFKGIPPIIGWPDESFIEIMNEYRTKKRPNQVMQTIAGKLSDEEVAALAAFFGALKPKN
jgi:cytochrome c